MRGVRFFGDGIRTSSVIMQNEPHRIRFIDSIHVAVRHGREDPLLTNGRRSRDRSPIVRNRASRDPQVASDGWRRNVFAVTAASFMGYTGFTLVMPFLPLFIGQLGVTDVGADRDVDRLSASASRRR